MVRALAETGKDVVSLEPEVLGEIQIGCQSEPGSMLRRIDQAVANRGEVNAACQLQEL